MRNTITFPQLVANDSSSQLVAIIPSHLCVGATAEPFLYGGSGFAACIAVMEYVTGLPAIYASVQFVDKAQSGQIINFSPEYVSIGKSIKQFRLAADVDGRPFATLLGAVGGRSDMMQHQGIHAPIVPDIYTCPEKSVARQVSSNLNALFEFRLANGQLPDRRDWSGEVGQDTAYWIRKRSGAMMTRLDLPVIADLAAMALPSALGKPTSGNSLDNMIRFACDPKGEWVLSYTRVATVQRGLAHIDTQIFSETGTLLAVASQSMILRTRPPA